MSLIRSRLILNAFIIRYLFLFLLLPTVLTALDPDKKITQYCMKSWNMESGLPGNSVFVIRQTQDGYLWIGTQDGLVRFDGVDFEVFDQGRIPKLEGDIRALYQDRQGNLWIGSESGGLTRFKDGEFSLYSISKNKTFNKISAIKEDQWGNLWIGSFKEGLTCLSNGTFTFYTTKDGLPDNGVNDIYQDRKGDLWVVTSAGIVKMLKPGLFQPYHYKGVMLNNLTACLYKEETKELWIGTGDNYLFRMRNGKKTSYRAEAGVPHHIITCLFEDSMKNLWIGTDGGGLTRMSEGVFSTFPVGDDLSTASVCSIYEDREGSLWVGTLDDGLLQLRDDKFTTYTVSEGMAHEYITCVYESRAGDLWIGTQEGLNRLSKGTLTTVLSTRDGLLHKSVLSLFEDSEGYLWIGTQAGLHRFKDGKLTPFTEKNGLSSDTITCILEDSRGNIWIGTSSGLNRFDNNNGKFSVFTLKQGFTNNSIEFIFEDNRANLWIGTSAGLNCLKDDYFTAYSPDDGFRDKHFKCAYEDKEGVLWFGTNNGFIKLKGEKITYYNVKCGLIDNYVYSILEDDGGYLWLGGRKGISRVRKKELEDLSKGLVTQVFPDSFNETDGMKSRWCTNAGCRTRDGRFWFPTAVGVAMIHPDSIKKNKAVPSVIIKSLVVDGEPVHIQSGVGRRKTVKLAPGKKRLEIYYTGVSFINPEKIRFKIRLAGYDRDWVEKENVRSTTYTGLSPGQYTFQVMATNADGIWSRESASLSFYLQPFFYQTAWFYILAVFIVFLAAFLFYRFRVGQLRAREKELGTLVEQRTKDLKERNIELEQAQQKIRHSKELIEAKNRQLEEQSEKLKEMDKVKSRFFANISHEFRTPLTLIMGPLEQMLSDSENETQKKKLNLMLRNSQRLLGLINQLLELSKFESGRVKLRASRQNVIPLLRGFVANFEPLAAQSELNLSFHAEEEDIPIYVDAEKLEDIIANLLINAVKFTPAGGKITVTAKRIDRQDDFNEGYPSGHLEISVRDTGPGIPREQLAHIFERFYQVNGAYEQRGKGSGIGLALVKELVQLHHGKIDVFSRAGEGTEFLITFPLGDAHLEVGEIVDIGVSDVGSPPENKQKFLEVSEPFSKKVLTRRRQEEDIEALAAEKEIILVVEDNADVRDYIRGSLEPDYAVVEAVDGQEGLQKAQEIIPDLIISDILMPGIDGYELCKILKKDIKTSHVPIILLTARASEESIVRGLETGADDYITKPFNTKILTARIKNLIDLRRQLQLNINREMTMQPAAISVSAMDKEFLKDLKSVINKNLSDPDFNVDLLAKKLYMDRSTIYRKVLALTGETPTDFIRSCRLKQGAKLLKNNFGTVLEVALEVGFSSANYFTKCFKKKFNQLPSTFQHIGEETTDFAD